MLEPDGANRYCVLQGAERIALTSLRRCIVPALAALTALWLTACAGLPPRGEPPRSQAYTDTETTTLARLAQSSRPQGEVAPSGFRLLPTGEFAFNARVAMVRHAERSADVVALGEVEVLGVSERFLDRLRRRDPRIAARLFLNLTRIVSDRLERMNERLLHRASA